MSKRASYDLTSRINHWIIAVSMIGMVGFGLFAIPAQSGIDSLARLAGEIHQVIGIGLAVLIAIHVAAALKHHLIDKDATLTRMLTGRTAKPRETR